MPLFVPELQPPSYVAARFYPTSPLPTSSAAPAAVDIVYLYAFPVYYTLNVVSLFGRVTTGGAGSSVKVGVWADSPISHRPLGAPLIVDNTGTDTSGSSTNFTVNTTDTVLAQGWYWMGTKFTGTLPSMVSRAAAPEVAFFMGGATNAALLTLAFSSADAYANNMPTFAEAASFTAVTTVVPLIGLGT